MPAWDKRTVERLSPPLNLRIIRNSRDYEEKDLLTNSTNDLLYGIIKISIEGGIFMMGKQNGQIQMAILDIDYMIPEDHLLRQIKEDLLTISFSYVYFGIFSSVME